MPNTCLSLTSSQEPQFSFGIESIQILGLVFDPSVSTYELTNTLSTLMTSNIALYMKTFQTEFVAWVRLNSTLVREMLLEMNTEMDLAALSDASHPISEDHNISSIVRERFLSETELTYRLYMFLHCARLECTSYMPVSTTYGKPGFCPMAHLSSYREFYPFHLVQVVRLCAIKRRVQAVLGSTCEPTRKLQKLLALGVEAVSCENDDPESLVCLRMGPFHVLIRPVTKQDAPEQSSLIEPSLWKLVYNLPDAKNLPKGFELRIARMLQQLIEKFVAGQLNDMVSVSDYMQDKILMWNYFQEKCKNFM